MKWVFVVFGVAVVLLATLCPLPIRSEIATISAGDKTVSFYWKPAGVLGWLSADNPWVYATVSSGESGSTLTERVWADTPCDGVARLSKRLDLSAPSCVDGTNAVQQHIQR